MTTATEVELVEELRIVERRLRERALLRARELAGKIRVELTVLSHHDMIGHSFANPLRNRSVPRRTQVATVFSLTPSRAAISRVLEPVRAQDEHLTIVTVERGQTFADDRLQLLVDQEIELIRRGIGDVKGVGRIDGQNLAAGAHSRALFSHDEAKHAIQPCKELLERPIRCAEAGVWMFVKVVVDGRTRRRRRERSLQRFVRGALRVP